MSGQDLMVFYEAMLERYGKQGWWPGDSPLEVMIGAVLTQNTAWSNVEKAIKNLKAASCLDVERLYRLEAGTLAEIIKPAGYFNIKAKRLKNLMAWLYEQFEGDLSVLEGYSVGRLREELLGINGIGRETADSIILYAFNKPTFVVDTYTYRVLVRHGCLLAQSDYEMIKEYCESHLPMDAALYNEYHALLVCLGKNHCKPKAKCLGCPLEPFEHRLEEFED